MKKERYQRIGLRISRMGAFKDIHNCGAPTKYNPVNLYCKTFNGITIYVGQGFVWPTTDWTIEYSYDPDMDIRAKMITVRAKNQKEMFQTVQDILDGKYRKDGE